MLTPDTATNWASADHGVRLVDFSSQVEECDAEHVLDNSINTIWLTKEGLPQWLCFSLLDATSLQDLQVKTVGWHCWHAYTTNPKSVTLHVSSDGSKFRRWDNFTVDAASDQVQLFNCAPISPKVYPYIAFEINATFGGEQTYLNRIYLFTDEVSHPAASQTEQRSPSSTLDTESLVQVLDQALHAEENHNAAPDQKNAIFPEYRRSRGFGSTILRTPATTSENSQPRTSSINGTSTQNVTAASRYSSVDRSATTQNADAMLRILKLENRIEELICELQQLRDAAEPSHVERTNDMFDQKPQTLDVMRSSFVSSVSDEHETMEKMLASRSVRHAATSTDSVADIDATTGTYVNASAASTIESLTQSVRHLETLLHSSHEPISLQRPHISEEPHLPPVLSRRGCDSSSDKRECHSAAFSCHSHRNKGPGGVTRLYSSLSLHPQSTSLTSAHAGTVTAAELGQSSATASSTSSCMDDDVYRITAKLHDKLLQRTIKEAQLRVIRENKAKRKQNVRMSV